VKRFVAGLLSLALVLVAPPPSAWAQFAEAARGASSAGASAAAAAAVVVAPLPSLSLAPLGAPALTAAPAPAAPLFAPGFRPIELTAPAPAPAPSAPKAAPAAAPAPAAALAPPAAVSEKTVPAAAGANAVPGGASALAPTKKDVPSARVELEGAARGLGAANALPALALDRLFTGAADHRGLDREAAVSVPSDFAAALPALAAASTREGGPSPSVPGPAAAPKSRAGSRLLGAAAAFGRFALAAGAVLGLNAAAVAFSPALFAVVPVAAVWAVSSGLLLFPAGLYARYRLARRDSPRLNKVKILLDVALGAYAGALVIAAPGLALTLSSAGLLSAALPAAGLAAGLATRGAPFLNSVLVWGALGFTPLAVGAAAVGGIAIAPLLGILALPAMTTIAFFLGSLITAAETGRPFAVPGTLQKMRFPSFQWVMIGVVFSLLTGYSAVHTNLAFLAWNILGSRVPSAWDKSKPLWKNVLNKAANFDILYVGLAAFVAIGGFTSPLTFLVLAFSGERAAVWTERLLTRFLPHGNPAPSTKAAPIETEAAADKPALWPHYHYWAKTFGILAAMAGAGIMMGLTVFGFHSLLTSMLPAVALAALPFWFATSIIKLVMRDKPAEEAHDPEFFAIMKGLREKINARRRAAGKKEIPMPELVNDPLPLPNAYATGRSPFHALVGVTAGIKEMTLDPENVRDGVARLIAGTAPGTKAYKVFRLAIAGSISGVTEGSSPADVQAAVLKADRVELKALGVRMLTGVLGHEFSHVMDRHMLSGAIAGAVSSSIAFASYGVMWAVGHAQAAGKKLVDRLLGRRASETEPRAKLSDEEDGGGTQSKTLIADPISVGVAVKSLPALLKLFAALWVPVMVQIVQMAASRNNEGMADEDGAILSEDPQSLALALGLLTTWRPRPGFMLPGTTIPRVIGLSPMMTVNPLDQAYRAGALPKLDAFTEAVVGKGDDFLFDLFVTHPDTAVRIEKLSDMSDALRAAKPSRARPPTGDGGAPPLALNAPSGALVAPARSGGGFFRRFWEKAKAFYRVLPDEGRNKAFWAYTWGQALATVGADFYYTALPNLVAPTKADTAKLGYNRAVNWGAQAAGSLLTGPFVDRQPVQRTLVWTYVGRGVLMAVVPLLFVTGHFGFAAFCLLVGMAGFLQATAGTAGSVAFNRILGDDEAFYNRANAIMTIVTNVVGVVGPLMAGAFIAWAGTVFALPLMGSALAYGVYAAMLLATGVGYGLLLKLPRDEMLQARRDLLDRVKTLDLGGARVKGVAAGRAPDGRTALVVEIAGGDPALAKGIPPEFAGYPVLAAAPRNALRELAEGFKMAWSDRFLRLYLLLSTLSIASGDSLVFAALPRYLSDVLKAGPGAFGILLAASSLGMGLSSAALTWVKDPAQAALAPISKEFRAALAAREPDLDAGTLDRAAVAVRGSLNEVLERYKAEDREGRGRAHSADELASDVLAAAVPELAKALELQDAEAASLLEASGAARDVRVWAARRGDRYVQSARKDAKSGMDSLQRQGRWSNLLHATSWLAYAGVFFAHSLWPSVGLMLLSAILAGPGGIIWASLTTRVVAGSFPNDQGKVYSAMTFYMLACSVVGVLGLGWLMAAVPTTTALLVAAGILLACTGFDVILSFAVFPLRRK
jgi:Zn-dependent protease with chaperone function